MSLFISSGNHVPPQALISYLDSGEVASMRAVSKHTKTQMRYLPQKQLDLFCKHRTLFSPKKALTALEIQSEIQSLQSSLNTRAELTQMVADFAIGLLLGVGDFIKFANMVDAIALPLITCGSSENPNNRISGFSSIKEMSGLVSLSIFCFIAVTQAQQRLLKKKESLVKYYRASFPISVIGSFVLLPSFRQPRVPFLFPFDLNHHTSNEFLNTVGMMATFSAIATVLFGIIGRRERLENLKRI